MERSVITAIAARDVRSGVRNRWFMLYAIVFIMLSVGFSMLAMGGSSLTGQPGFGRTAAGLLNLMLLMVPLIGLTIGAQSLVGERQDRSLDYLMAQPISPREIFLGKYLGAAASLALLLLLGFGVSGVVMAVRGAATGLTLWLLLVIVGDLGLMSSAIVMDLSPGTLLTLTLANPLDVYKLLGVDLLQTSLDVLGPAGVYANSQLGGVLTPLLAILLLIWIVAPLPIGYLLFTRKDVR